MQFCKNCQKKVDTEHDPGSGDTVCSQCGQVISGSNIVSELTFGETSSGAAMVTGQFVGADRAHASGTVGQFGSNIESREVTIEKCKRRINNIAAKLGVPEYVAGAAHQYFKMALTFNFAKGRKSQYVVCACLYLACRQNKTVHMLMDFAEAIYVNVFAIGSTYLQLVKTLGLTKIPTMDPSLFIKRFAARLDFGDDTNKICKDAARLVHRMGKDWITHGRRPAGVAAACLLLAGRMNNHRISKAQIVNIAKIGEETVQRRLDEFAKTNAASLSVSMFRATNIESEADPPSFTKNREKEKKREDFINSERAKLAKGDYGIDKDMETLADEIDKALEEAEHRRLLEEGQTSSSDVPASTNVESVSTDGAEAAAAAEPVPINEEESVDRESSTKRESPTAAAEEASTNGAEAPTTTNKQDEAAALPSNVPKESDAASVNTAESSKEKGEDAGESGADVDMATDRNVEPKDKDRTTTDDQTTTRTATTNDRIEDAEEETEEEKKKRERTRLGKRARRVDYAEQEEESEVETEEQAERLAIEAACGMDVAAKFGEADVVAALQERLNNNNNGKEKKMSRGRLFLENYRRQKAMFLEAMAKEDEPLPRLWVSKISDDPDHLSDVDDDEIESIRLTDDEVKWKTKVWMTLNRDYLIEQENKRLKIQADIAAGTYKEPKKRKPRAKREPHGGLPNITNATPLEQAKQMLEKRKFSKKLNYDAMNVLFQSQNPLKDEDEEII